MAILRNTYKESKITSKRLIIVCIMISSLFTILLRQIYKLQITHTQHYETIAQKNNARDFQIAPYRADILDRNDYPLATFKPEFILYINNEPSQTDQYHLKHIGINDYSQNHTSILPEQFAYLYNQTLDSISVKHINKRHYPLGPAAAHIIGYVGSPKHSAKIEPYDANSTIIEGHSGLERLYNNYLSGDMGVKTQYVNAKMEIKNISMKKEPSRNQPLALTINHKLQSAVYDSMLGHTGSVIIINPNNGEILAAVSSPSFDPSNPTKHNHIKLNNVHNDQPMFNRITHSLYPPGSIIKPFVGLMALQEDKIRINESINDPGYYKINDNSRSFRCWKKNGHGDVNLSRAIITSCDTYFYELSRRLGIDTLSRYLKTFKFGEQTDIGFGSEATPIVPDQAYRNQKYKKWYTGQTIITGIGQGDLLISPIQLARSTMLLANQGIDYPIHLFKNYHAKTVSKLPIDPNAHKHIVNAMEEVMKNGTGKLSEPKQYTVAGKTGSAQVAELTDTNLYKSLPRSQKDHHLFIGFSPAYNPKIAMVVIIEHQHAAKQVAESILDWYWQEQKKIQLET